MKAEAFKDIINKINEIGTFKNKEGKRKFSVCRVSDGWHLVDDRIIIFFDEAKKSAYSEDVILRYKSNMCGSVCIKDITGVDYQ